MQLKQANIAFLPLSSFIHELSVVIRSLPNFNRFGGVYSGGVTPDPISNSEVKPACGKPSTGEIRRKRSTMPPFIS